ncbi:hypothetical protein [Streptomyces sp. NPDC048565]|uniref:hypothetical protein n=1 Tax=Streptomyces sp. NPDC048565 TaxID=3155266 RepID=UPI00343749DC
MRYDFGRGVADFVVAPADGIWMVSANTEVTFWSAQDDGQQYTDLLDAEANPIAFVTSDEYGQIPGFSGPDEVFGMWADAGGGRRAWLYAHSGGKGAPGDPGAHWHFGTGGPDDAEITPVDGDLFVDTESGDLYSYNGTAWSLQTNLTGPEGPAGSGDVESVNGQTGEVVLTADDVGALAATARGATNGVASLDGTGQVPAEQLPAAPVAPGVWLPSDYGLSGWAYDLHASSRTPGDAPSEAQRLYLIGVPLRQAKSVSQVAIHVMGYNKSATTLTNAYFGIYDSEFTRLSATTNQMAQLPEVHNVGGQIARINLTSAVSLSAGYYYVAILFRGTSTTSAPYLAATNWTGSETTSGAVGVSTSGVHRWLQSTSTSYTSLPTTGTLTSASFAETQTCYWAAIV